MASVKICKDCAAEGVTSKRKAPYPGPRCTTHHRRRKSQRREYSHRQHIEETYNISYEQYWSIYDIQGNRCYLCRRATGMRRKLAVDHDHSCCPKSTSCGRCVRGLLCSTCNNILGHFRDDPEALQRAIDYLEYPPARAVLGDV